MQDLRAAAAWLDHRSAPCFHHALLLQRSEARPYNDPAADPVLNSVLAALAELRLDEDARALGLRSEHIAAVRSALAALLDESASQTPGSEPWRDHLFSRVGLPRSAHVGHEFFVELERRLSLPASDPADLLSASGGAELARALHDAIPATHLLIDATLHGTDDQSEALRALHALAAAPPARWTTDVKLIAERFGTPSSIARSSSGPVARFLGTCGWRPMATSCRHVNSKGQSMFCGT